MPMPMPMPMPNSKPEQLCFHPIDGLTVRADFEGGALSSDFGALLLRETELQCSLVARLAGAIRDSRHPAYIAHAMQDLLMQRVLQVACGYADANDSTTLRHDPMFKLAAGRRPLETDNPLAHASTFTRLEQALSQQDLYRLSEAFIAHFLASYAKPPAVTVLDLDHTEHRVYGQQELALFNRYCGGPLLSAAADLRRPQRQADQCPAAPGQVSQRAGERRLPAAGPEPVT